MSVRFATKKDYPAMLEIYRPYVENTRISFEYETPSLSTFKKRISEISKKHPVLVYEEDGKVLGYAYTADVFERRAYCWCAELSVYVERECRGKGIGKRLVVATEDIARFLGYKILYSLITEDNAASIEFHRALGYKQVAFFPEQGYKFGEWAGVVWYEKRLSDNTGEITIPPCISRVYRPELDEIIKKYE